MPAARLTSSLLKLSLLEPVRQIFMRFHGRPIRVALKARLRRDEKAAGRNPSYGHGGDDREDQLAPDRDEAWPAAVESCRDRRVHRGSRVLAVPARNIGRGFDQVVLTAERIRRHKRAESVQSKAWWSRAGSN